MTPSHPSLRVLKTARHSGFTLIEVLLVVVIIGVLAAVVVPKLTKRGEDARKTGTRASISSISVMIEAYEVDNDYYPASLQALMTKGSELNWKGPYLKKAPIDEWGKEFVYTLKDNDYELRSAGPNGVAGDSDDLTL